MSDQPKSTSKIVVNGQEVSLDQAPEFVRQFLVDADKNGIPDSVEQIFKNPFFKMIAGKAGERLKTQLVQNAKDLTPEQQAKIQTLLDKLSGGVDLGTSVSVTTTTTSSSRTPLSSSAPIDYRALGIPNPEQKSSVLWPTVGIILAGLLGWAVWYALTSH